MKSLDLNNYGLVELDNQEQSMINGGILPLLLVYFGYGFAVGFAGGIAIGVAKYLK